MKWGRAALAAVVAVAVPTASAAPWQYKTEVDKMTDKKAHYASVRSHNQLRLAFPYHGPNRGTLTIRSHPKYGTNVILRVDKGQILCQFATCTISVRVDDNPPWDFPAVGAADYDSTVIFFGRAFDFIDASRYASRIRVQIPMYEAGDQILEFRPSKPLHWDVPY